MTNIKTGFSTKRAATIFFQVLFFTMICAVNLIAQPSGGPYGPIHQTYELPKTSGKIFYVAPDGKAEQAGESIAAPTTIESAIEKVKTGDAIILRGGTYRTGNLLLNQGITIQPYKDEQPVLKGTFVADKWENLGNGLWKTKWTRLFFQKPADWWRRDREGKKTPQHKFNNDMVFVDGRFLQSAGWEGEVNENTFYIDYETGTVYIGIDPANKLVEITAYDGGLIRTTKEVHGKASDKKGYTLRGITFTQYAYRALEIEGFEPEGISPEENHGKDVVGTTIENCTITFCSRVAGYLRGDHMTIRNCKVSDTSTEGIYILSSSDVLLERNIIARNNIEQITGYYPAAVKIFNQTHRVTCNDNYVTDLPYSNGIWYDVGNVDGVFTNNWIENVGNLNQITSTERPWPSDNGFFFEISKGAVCAGNVFVNCDHGVMVLNSCNVSVYNNTFINSMAWIARDQRSAQGDHFGWHPSTGPDVDKRDGHVFVNNLMYGDKNFSRIFLNVWQPAMLCEKVTNIPLKEMESNVYIREAGASNTPFVLWSPAKNEKCQQLIKSPDELKNFLPQFSANTKYEPGYNGAFFKGIELRNFRPIESFTGKQLPADIGKKTGITKNYVGAYPPVK